MLKTMQPDKLIGTERLCPHCGYDLRAAPQRDGLLRCPECGRESRPGLASSRIPWPNRRAAKRRLAHERTTWMSIRHPLLLGQEIHTRVAKRHARSFARISVWIGVLFALIIAGGWLALMHAAGGFGPDPFSVQPSQAWLVYPVFAAADWRLLFPVIALWSWLTLTTLGVLYRSMLSLMLPRRITRRRVRRLASYMMGLAPLEVLLLGAAFLASIIAGDTIPAPDALIHAAPLLAITLLIAAALLLLIPTAAFAWSTGGRRAARATLMTLAFPPLAALISATLLLITAWILGYAAMAAWSISH